MRKLLTKCHFSPQKPAYVAYEQCPEQVRSWLETDYPALRRKARTQHGLIFWLDETGIRSQHASGSSYSPVGHTPVIAKTGQRFYCNVISALSNGGRLLFTVLSGGFKTDVFLDFLKKLIRAVGKKVFVVADNHPVHNAKRVKAWLAQHRGQIELHQLPLYAPELNADEFFNQHLKSHGTGKSRPANRAALIQIVRRFSRSVQHKPKLVRAFFNAGSVQYARRYTKLGPD